MPTIALKNYTWELLVTFSSREVHISKTTFDALQGAYNVQPADGKSRNSLLAKYDVETFFVTSRNNNNYVMEVNVW